MNNTKNATRVGDFPKIDLEECARRIRDTRRPLILMHVRPDGDTVGTAAALCRIFTRMGRHPYYACPDRIPERLSFLTEGLECAIDPETREPLTDLSELEPIAVDVPSVGQLGFISELVTVGLTVDHHAVSTPYSPHYTVAGASSAGEVLLGIAELLAKWGEITLDREIAEPLYAAIASDTGGFAYSSATPTTYRRAAGLIELGIDHTEICRRLFSSKSRDQLRAEGYVASKMQTDAGGRIAYFTLSLAERESLGLDHAHFECAIDVVRSLIGCELAMTVKEAEPGSYKASLRSTGPNVAEVAAGHSGGGHALAAGCSPVGGSVSEAAESLLCDLRKLLKM